MKVWLFKLNSSSFILHPSAFLLALIDQCAESAYAYAVHAHIEGERFKALNR
jgi:hypothetical protein